MNAMRREIQSLMKVEPRENGFRATLDVSPTLTVLADHFPGFPLLPGICMMQAILLAGAVQQKVSELRLHTVKNAKMLQPIRPGDQLIIDGEITAGKDDDIMIKATLSSNEKRCAEFSLLARPTGLAAAPQERTAQQGTSR